MMIDFFEFAGFILLAAWCLVGGFVWLRWGYTGVELIWQKRLSMDEAVRREVWETMKDARLREP